MTRPADGIEPLTSQQRDTYAKLADFLIPHAEGMLSASQADVPTQWIDEALRLRPDLRPALLTAIEHLNQTGSAKEALTELATQDRATFDSLTNLTAGAYFMDDRVRDAIGYPGQEQRRLTDDTADYVDLLARVAERGPLYRSTPTSQ